MQFSSSIAAGPGIPPSSVLADAASAEILNLRKQVG
jgi:hypothetical protein